MRLAQVRDGEGKWSLNVEDSAWEALLRVAEMLTVDETTERFIRPSRCGCAARRSLAGRIMADSLPSPNVVPVPEGTRPKLLDQVRHTIHMRHYSRRTETTYVHWIRRFIVFHHKKHPSTMGAPEITAGCAPVLPSIRFRSGELRRFQPGFFSGVGFDAAQTSQASCGQSRAPGRAWRLDLRVHSRNTARAAALRWLRAGPRGPLNKKLDC
jgi:hypothetical protein